VPGAWAIIPVRKETITVTTTLDEPALESIDPRTVGIQIEAKLRDWNLSYEYVPAFPIEKIRAVDWTQVRSSTDHAGVDKQTLGEFRMQMMQGAVYPPIVVMEPDVLVDGNHRVAVAKSLRRKTFPAFVVRFSSVDLAKSFNAAMNQLNGRRLTTQEAFQAAVTMMERGMADEAIAREIGRAPSSVRDMRRQNEFAERSSAMPELRKLMEKAPIPARAQQKLAGISHDPAFAEAVKVVAETRAPMQTVNEIVEAAAKARTDTDAIVAVRAKRAELAPAGPPPHRVTVPQAVRNCRMWLGGILKFRENATILLDTQSDETRAKAAEQWKQVRDLAAEMIDLYGKRD
jgi:ParB-like chromosome segregation protein Spo0J